MQNLKRHAKFFCESCGAEVPHNSKICLNCGKFFASVRCPNCGKTGSSSTFINGCPDCGYAVSGSSKKQKNYNYRNKIIKNNNSHRSPSLFWKRNNNSSYRNTSNESGLPLWIYLLVSGILLVLIICLYNCMI